MAIINGIANEYVDRQLQCKEPNYNTNSKCVVKDDQGNQYHVQTMGEPKPIRITAMSLRYGGLNDIGPNAGISTATFWNPPHSTHNDGRTVDIGISELDNNLKLLLRQTINDNQYLNLQNIEPCEGGTNLVTPNNDCSIKGFPALANHIHVNFVR